MKLFILSIIFEFKSDMTREHRHWEILADSNNVPSSKVKFGLFNSDFKAIHSRLWMLSFFYHEDLTNPEAVRLLVGEGATMLEWCKSMVNTKLKTNICPFTLWNHTLIFILIRNQHVKTSRKLCGIFFRISHANLLMWLICTFFILLRYFVNK